MKKKKYMKPSMKVYEFEQQPRLLAGSSGDGGMVYIPGISHDENKLA